MDGSRLTCGWANTASHLRYCNRTWRSEFNYFSIIANFMDVALLHMYWLYTRPNRNYIERMKFLEGPMNLQIENIVHYLPFYV